MSLRASGSHPASWEEKISFRHVMTPHPISEHFYSRLSHITPEETSPVSRVQSRNALATASGHLSGFALSESRAWGLPACPHHLGLVQREGQTHQGRDARVAVDEGQAGQADDDVLEHRREECRGAAVPFMTQGQHQRQCLHHLGHHPTGCSDILRV